MGVIQHRQIEDAVENTFAPHLIDDADGKLKDDDTRKSRGLAAFAVAYLTETDPKESAQSVVDGFGDGGIDAVHFDGASSVLYLVQSKWNKTHTKSIDKGDTLKFADGIKNLLSGRESRFKGKIAERWQEISRYVGSARSVVLAVVYSGAGSFSPECTDVMNALVDEIDETRELVSFQVIKQNQLHSMLLEGATGGPIIEAVSIQEWGKVGEEISAYYGQVAASDLARMHQKYGNRLFSKNIRFFLGSSTQVNSGIRGTLENDEEKFWFLNNGVTALADKVTRRPIGGGTRASGVFDCQGLVIVNGAQTVGTISEYLKGDGLINNGAMVPFRVISLENASEEFAAEVTRTNNTQNRIDARNFVTLDSNQERLRGEFAVDGITYEYRQGEIENSSSKFLGLVEATLALACTQKDIDLAVQAKREIGKLWEDIHRTPYRLIFNSSVTSEYIWARVKAFRKINDKISFEEVVGAGRKSQIATHGNRLIVNLVYNNCIKNGSLSDISDVDDNVIHSLVASSIDTINSYIEENFENAYLAVLFKNRAKCTSLADEVRSKLV